MSSKQVSFEDTLLTSYGDEDDQIEMFDYASEVVKQAHPDEIDK